MFYKTKWMLSISIISKFMRKVLLDFMCTIQSHTLVKTPSDCRWSGVPTPWHNTNTLYAKLSPLSTRGHQSQLGHMTKWGRYTIYLAHASGHVCSALSWYSCVHCSAGLHCLLRHGQQRVVVPADVVAPKATGGIVHHPTTVVYLYLPGRVIS